jgi:glycosyltransferase involved in cell wall biosynthesis
MKQVLGYLCGSESWGGLEMNHVRSAAWMQERGHKVVYFCLENSRTHEFANDCNLQVIFIKKHKKYYDFNRGIELVRLLNLHAVTHLLIRSNSDVSLIAFAKHKLKTKLHTSYFMEMQLGVEKKNLLHTIRYRYIDLWSCPLNYPAEQVKTMTNFKNKLVIIPSAIDLNRFRNIDRSEARRMMDLPEDQFFFGLAGRFDPQKGQLLLLEAMAQCESKKFSVVLLGEPTLHEDGDEYYRAMQEVISTNKLHDRVFFRPFRTDIEVFYNAIDWFVMATKAETFGMVTIESIACGTPVLGSNAGGTPEIIQGLTMMGGELFETQNRASLAQKLSEIANSNRTVEQTTLNEIAQLYSHEIVCSEIEKALDLK